jgi:hypothetical protein
MCAATKLSRYRGHRPVKSMLKAVARHHRGHRGVDGERRGANDAGAAPVICSWSVSSAGSPAHGQVGGDVVCAWAAALAASKEQAKPICWTRCLRVLGRRDADDARRVRAPAIGGLGETFSGAAARVVLGLGDTRCAVAGPPSLRMHSLLVGGRR